MTEQVWSVHFGEIFLMGHSRLSQAVKIYMYGLLTKREVMMAGYWPSSSVQFRVDIHKLAQKEQGQYSVILTEKAWSIKDLLYGFRGNGR